MTFPTEWNNNKCSKPQTNYNILYISIRRILPACIIHSQHMVRSCLSGLGWYPQSLGPGKRKNPRPKWICLKFDEQVMVFHGISFKLPCLAGLHFQVYPTTPGFIQGTSYGSPSQSSRTSSFSSIEIGKATSRHGGLFSDLCDRKKRAAGIYRFIVDISRADLSNPFLVILNAPPPYY